MKLCILANSKVLILNTTIDFSYSDLKYPNNAILIPNSKYSYCADETLHFDKFEGADFKYFQTPFPKILKKDNFDSRFNI